MIDLILSHPWSCCMAWIIMSFFVWSWLVVASRADDEAEKIVRLLQQILREGKE